MEQGHPFIVSTIGIDNEDALSMLPFSPFYYQNGWLPHSPSNGWSGMGALENTDNRTKGAISSGIFPYVSSINNPTMPLICSQGGALQELAANDAMSIDEKIDKLESLLDSKDVDSSYYNFFNIDPSIPDTELSEEQLKTKNKIKNNFSKSHEVLNLASAYQEFAPSYGTCLWKLDKNSDEFKKRQKAAALSASLSNAAAKARMTGDTTEIDKIVDFIREKGGYTGDLGKNTFKMKESTYKGDFHYFAPSFINDSIINNIEAVHKYADQHPDSDLSEIGMSRNDLLDLGEGDGEKDYEAKIYEKYGNEINNATEFFETIRAGLFGENISDEKKKKYSFLNEFEDIKEHHSEKDIDNRIEKFNELYERELKNFVPEKLINYFPKKSGEKNNEIDFLLTAGAYSLSHANISASKDKLASYALNINLLEREDGKAEIVDKKIIDRDSTDYHSIKDIDEFDMALRKAAESMDDCTVTDEDLPMNNKALQLGGALEIPNIKKDEDGKYFFYAPIDLYDENIDDFTKVMTWNQTSWRADDEKKKKYYIPDEYLPKRSESPKKDNEEEANLFLSRNSNRDGEEYLSGNGMASFGVWAILSMILGSVFKIPMSKVIEYDGGCTPPPPEEETPETTPTTPTTPTEPTTPVTLTTPVTPTTPTVPTTPGTPVTPTTPTSPSTPQTPPPPVTETVTPPPGTKIVTPPPVSTTQTITNTRTREVPGEGKTPVTEVETSIIPPSTDVRTVKEGPVIQPPMTIVRSVPGQPQVVEKVYGPKIDTGGEIEENKSLIRRIIDRIFGR